MNIVIYGVIFHSIEWTTLEDHNDVADIERCISMYQRIYSFNNLCNTIYGSAVIPTCKGALMIAFIIFFFGSARLHEELDFLTLAFAIVVFSTSFIMICTMSIVLSSLYEISTVFKPNIGIRIQKLSQPLDKKILNRELKACQTMSCQVGSLHHMEAEAKLTLADSLINGVAWLLINVKV